MTVTSTTRAGVCRILLDRPDDGNALDEVMIDDLATAITAAAADAAVHVVVVGSTGRHLSTGYHPDALRREAEGGLAGADAAVARAIRLLGQVDACQKPIVVRVEGYAFGLIVALVAAADVAIASEDAEFSVPDVRHGAIPAAVAPYLVRAMGIREARRMMLTGDRIRAADARAAGLVHEVAPRTGLDTVVDRTVLSLVKGDPVAILKTKDLMAAADGPVDGARLDEMRRRYLEAAEEKEAARRAAQPAARLAGD